MWLNRCLECMNPRTRDLLSKSLETENALACLHFLMPHLLLLLYHTDITEKSTGFQENSLRHIWKFGERSESFLGFFGCDRGYE